MSIEREDPVIRLLELHDGILESYEESDIDRHKVFDDFIMAHRFELSRPENYRRIGDLWSTNRLSYMPWHFFSDIATTLVISYNFAPYADASAVTVAKRIRDLGVPVHVISQNLASIRNEDPQLLRLVEPYAVNIRRVNNEATFANWRLIKAFVASAMDMLGAELASGKYVRIYSRSMFPASHVLAAHIKSLFPRIEWIAEFSDPIQHTVEGNLRTGGDFIVDAWSRKLISKTGVHLQSKMLKEPSVFAWCEYLPFAMADSLWFTNEFQREVMLREISDPGTNNMLWNKSEVHGHPTYPQGYYSIFDGQEDGRSEGDTIRVGYFGEFYSNRGLDDLFRAVRLLPVALRRRIEICVYTGNTDACSKAASSYGIGSVVNVRKSLPLLEFFAVARRMNLLVVNDVIPGGLYGCNPYLPSKVSDYSGTGVDILAIIWPGSKLSQIPQAHKYHLGDVVGISNHLAYLVSGLKERSEDVIAQ